MPAASPRQLGSRAQAGWLQPAAALAVAAVAAAALAAAVLVWPRAKQPPPAAPAPAAPAPAERPVPAPEHASAPSPAPAPAAKPARLRLPDGSEVEPLNGVEQPAAMVWGSQAYAPIVGREHQNGLDWYVHADGTRTTTQMAWRQELGRYDAVTLVLHPKAPVATEAAGGR